MRLERAAVAAGEDPVEALRDAPHGPRLQVVQHEHRPVREGQAHERVLELNPVLRALDDRRGVDRVGVVPPAILDTSTTSSRADRRARSTARVWRTRWSQADAPVPHARPRIGRGRPRELTRRRRPAPRAAGAHPDERVERAEADGGRLEMIPAGP